MTQVVLDGEPVKIFQGKMDALADNDDGKSVVFSLTAESDLIDLQRSREMRLTDEAQKSLFPSDKGLEYVSAIQDKQIDIKFVDKGIPA